MKNRFVCVKAKTIFIAFMLSLALIVTYICAFARDDEEEAVLMFHQVSEKPGKLGKYVVSKWELEEDFELILNMGFTPVFASDLESYVYKKTTLPEKPIVITFDDGYMSDYVYVFPLLKKYNMKANFAIVGALADKYSSGIDRHVDYAQSTWDEISEMDKSGLAEFLSHSYDMHNLQRRKGVLRTYSETHEKYEKIMKLDIEENNDTFISHLGKEPSAFVYPFGNRNSETEDIVNEYFKITFGVYEKPNYIKDGDSLYKLNRYNVYHGRNIKKILADY